MDRAGPSPTFRRSEYSRGPFALVGAALIGTWLGHNLEYVRVFGPSRAMTMLATSAHAYIGTLGLVLGAAATVGVVGAIRTARLLERRLAQLRGAAQTDGAGAPSAPAGLLSPWNPTWPTLVGLLWTAQVCLYMLQEHLEAVAVGAHTPVLASVTGVHAWAPVVHLGVAALLAGVLCLWRRRIRDLAEDVRQAEQLLALWATPASVPRRDGGRPADPPLQRWGAQLWARPPPLRV